MSEKVSHFMVEYGDILLRVVRHEDLRIASQLVVFLTDTPFKTNILSGTLKALESAKMSPLEKHES